MENVNDLLKKSAASMPIKIDQTDPETAAQVAAFINEARAASGQTDPNQPAPGQLQMDPNSPAVDIRPPDDPLFQQSQHDAVLSEALVNTEQVAISTVEKSIFLKALLNDEPARLPVDLFGGQLKVELRTRTNFEQQRIFDIIDQDVASGVIAKTNFALQITRFQQYCMAIMTERVNGKLFSEIELKKGGTLDIDAKTMRDFVDKSVNGMDSIRWTALLNAMRIFETKIAKMSGEASNEDFWKPRASV